MRRRLGYQDIFRKQQHTCLLLAQSSLNILEFELSLKFTKILFWDLMRRFNQAIQDNFLDMTFPERLKWTLITFAEPFSEVLVLPEISLKPHPDIV